MFENRLLSRVQAATGTERFFIGIMRVASAGLFELEAIEEDEEQIFSEEWVAKNIDEFLFFKNDLFLKFLWP